MSFKNGVILFLTVKKHKNICFRYRKGFELQPTLYSGINLAVLLIVAGQQFESSMELRKIGELVFNSTVL